MTENQRLKSVIGLLKERRYIRNQQDFTERIGSDKSTVSQIVNGRTPIPNKMFAQIAQAFPMLNIDFILTGEGEMLKNDDVETLSGEEMAKISEGIKSGRFRLVPLVNIDSVGGIHTDNSIDLSEQYIIKMMPFADAMHGDVAILQSGNSMYPTIPPGSALLIREVKDWREYFGYGNIFVLLLKDGRRITKEVRRYDEDPLNYVWCVSYNPDVADEELPKSMIRSVWKVVKYIADFGW